LLLTNDLSNGGTALGNTAVGAAALLANDGGATNTAVGTGALINNNEDDQTAVGAGAPAANVSALENVAVGFNASANLTGGGINGFSVAVGFKALEMATDGQKMSHGFRLVPAGLDVGTC
jgi:hypothetical protein